MIDSMTAFAREQYLGTDGELVWEIRSVNHRYLEVSLRLPEELRGLETTVREHIGQRLQRGKLDCTLRYQPGANQQTTVLAVNWSLVQGLQVAAGEVSALLGSGTTPTTMDIMRWPGVLQEKFTDLGPMNIKAAILFDQALESLAATRRREGTRIDAMLRQRCQAIREHASYIYARIPEVLEIVRRRLIMRLQEVLNQLDPMRVEQEMVLLSQRLDIAEELDRIMAHLDEVERVLYKGQGVGRRLDFLMQELNRETNTLTSKVNDVEITHHAVDMKVLIEQMREQIQNIE